MDFTQEDEVNALFRLTAAQTVSCALPARAGLANEIFPLAKAWLAARALGVPLVPLPWGLNRRPYWRHFSSSRFDVLPYAMAMACRQHISFAEAEYRACGLVDYGEAVASWAAARELGQRRTALTHDGMWGGFPSIHKARRYVHEYLMTSPFAATNMRDILLRVPSRSVLIGVHVRRDDFAAPPRAGLKAGLWNVRIPVEWYATVCQRIRTMWGDTAQFLVVTDHLEGDVAELAVQLRALTTVGQRYPDVSDLLLLARADLLVCSVSSFSLTAAWLSDAPYLWPREQLHSRDGWLSMWGGEPIQAEGLTAAHRRGLARCSHAPVGRGIPVPLDGTLPGDLASLPIGRLSKWDPRADLLHYGVVRE